jgi:hypothetical protein
MYHLNSMLEKKTLMYHSFDHNFTSKPVISWWEANTSPIWYSSLLLFAFKYLLLLFHFMSYWISLESYHMAVYNFHLVWPYAKLSYIRVFGVPIHCNCSFITYVAHESLLACFSITYLFFLSPIMNPNFLKTKVNLTVFSIQTINNLISHITILIVFLFLAVM